MELFDKDSWSQNTNQALLFNSMNKQLTLIRTRERVEEIKKG